MPQGTGFARHKPVSDSHTEDEARLGGVHVREPKDLAYVVSKRGVVFISLAVFGSLIFLFSLLLFISIESLSSPAEKIERLERAIQYFCGLYIYLITVGYLRRSAKRKRGKLTENPGRAVPGLSRSLFGDSDENES